MDEVKRTVTVSAIVESPAEVEIALSTSQFTEVRAQCLRCDLIWTHRSDGITWGKTPEENVMGEAARHKCVPREVERYFRGGISPA